MTEREWTSEPPECGGWYWWRPANRWAHMHGDGPIVVCVEFDPGPRWFVPGSEVGAYVDLRCYPDSLWLGPIDPPPPVPGDKP